MLGADLQAGVPFYGAAAPTADVPKIRAPLLLHFAADDKNINDRWPEYEGALKAAGVSYDLFLSRDAARISQQLDAALSGEGGEARVGSHRRALQEESRLILRVEREGEAACRRPAAMRRNALRYSALRFQSCEYALGRERCAAISYAGRIVDRIRQR